MRSAVSSRSARFVDDRVDARRASSSPSRICSSSEPCPAAGVIARSGIGKAISSARAEPPQAGDGEHDPVELTLGELAQPGVDVAVQLAHLEVGPRGEQLGAAGAGSRCRPGRPRARRRAKPRPRSRRPRGSSRAGTAASISPSVSSAGRSLAEWTPISASPLEQRPLDPAHEARLVAELHRRKRPRPAQLRRASQPPGPLGPGLACCREWRSEAHSVPSRSRQGWNVLYFFAARAIGVSK